MAALAKAQGSFPDIERNRTVKVTPRSGGQSYEFKYATLSAIFHAIKKPLADNGIAYTQIMTHEPSTGYYVLTTTLFCGDQFISSPVPLILDNVTTNQQFGSALTYMKRYALAALLGIAADEDDDGNAADGNAVVAVKDKPHGPSVAPPPKPPAEDPISTGPQKVSVIPAGDEFSDAKIDVPMSQDGIHDWMGWGQQFMVAARSATLPSELASLEKNNATPMKNMEISAPKIFTNLTVALIKVRKALEKTNA